MASRLEAERCTARIELGNVQRSEWWDQARPEHIANAYQLATAWQHEEPEAVRASERIRDEVRTRYGIDVAAAGADPAAVRRLVEEAEHDRADAGDQRHRGAQDATEGAFLNAQAGEADRRAEESREAANDEVDGPERHHHEDRAAIKQARSDAKAQQAEVRYDGGERRDTMANDLESRGIDKETAATGCGPTPTTPCPRPRPSGETVSAAAPRRPASPAAAGHRPSAQD